MLGHVANFVVLAGSALCPKGTPQLPGYLCASLRVLFLPSDCEEFLDLLTVLTLFFCCGATALSRSCDHQPAHFGEIIVAPSQAFAQQTVVL